MNYPKTFGAVLAAIAALPTLGESQPQPQQKIAVVKPAGQKPVEKKKDGLRQVQKRETPAGPIELANLNVEINQWLTLSAPGLRAPIHLENLHHENKIALTPEGIEISNEAYKAKIPCPTLSAITRDSKAALDLQKAMDQHRQPYKKMCKGLLFARLLRESDTELSSTEQATAVLRRYGDIGESLINAVKPLVVMMDAESAETSRFDQDLFWDPKKKTDTQPPEALMDDEDKNLFALSHSLGIRLEDGLVDKNKLPFGRWVASELHDDVYISLFTPGLAPKQVQNSFMDRVAPLNQGEADKMVYLMAWDLDRFTLRYAVGLTHPGIDADRQEAADVVPIGKIPPWHIDRSVGVFIGGFKESHGQIRRGPQAGKRYGFIESGVELRPMSANLQTLMILKNGEVQIKRWPEEKSQQQRLRREVISARQNGVPLIEKGEPGKLVSNWGAGNWSGDAKGNLQTLRSAVCTVREGPKRFLVFAAFTGATPSGVARTLQAYRCQEAMHLDMNAWMYIHGAIMKKTGQNVSVEYLHQHMKYPKNITKHRFIYDNNERDFFYVMRKN